MTFGIEKSSSFSQDFKRLMKGDAKFAANLLSTISISSYFPTSSGTNSACFGPTVSSSGLFSIL
jgi:hypothetical protein